MLYIVSLRVNNRAILGYKVYDTCSDSVMMLKPEILRSILIAGKIPVVKTTIQDNQIILHDWVNNVGLEIGESESGLERKFTGAKYVLIAKIGSLYKVVDYSGNIFNISSEVLKDTIESKNVANCTTGNIDGKLKIKTTDIFEIVKDKEFESAIESRYKSFIAKTLLLGVGDMSFKYEIENKEVRLEEYTGSSKDVILPPFITAIMAGAFVNSNITSIKISSGLKVIGKRAFLIASKFKGLNHIELPETVELIGESAFAGNTKLFKANDTLDTSRFKLFNSNTVILDCGRMYRS